ncbi:MAG: PQQ-like beta-propeller repeat protein [Aureliella sp.]
MKINRRLALSASAAAALPLFSNKLLAGESDWPTWRGPKRDGYATGDQWPADLSSLKQVWSKDLSESYSGPIVFDGRVYTTETLKQQDETLMALDAKTGDEIWRKQWAGAMQVPFFAKANGDWIRSTPACDGKHIVVCGMRDVVACFDAATGEEKWRVDFEKLGEPLPSFGLVCSPLIDGDFVYLQAGGGVRKMQLATGETVWQAMRDGGGMYGGAFSSPTIETVHGVRQLLCQTRTKLCGIDLESGKDLWSREIKSFRGMNILTPTVWNDQVFTSSYGGRSQLIALEPGSDKWSTSVTWEGSAEAYMSSPVIVGDHLYMHLKNTRLSCISLADGEETWRTKPFGKYWSIITNGEELLALDEKGELLLVAANPEQYTLLDRKEISSEPTWAHVALADGHVFVRRLKGIDCYSWA